MMPPGSLYEAIGNNIRRIRLRRGITQEALAGLTSLSRASIANIEKGRQRLLVHTLWEIARALDVDPGELFPRTAAEPVSSGRARVTGTLADQPPAVRQWVEELVTTHAGSAEP